jgi:hypothetical protein
MKSTKSGKLDAAVNAFGQLPPEVLILGQPVSVHAPNIAARLKGRLSTTKADKRIALVLAIALPLIGAAFILPYLKGAPFGKAPPEGWLSIVGAGLLFGLLAGGYWLHLTRSDGKGNPPETPPRFVPGVILYREGIVQADNGKFTVILWEEVDELHAPTLAGCWRVLAKDGRKVDISGWLENEGTAIAYTADRVTAVLAPRFLAIIEAGKKAMFGPFGISRRHVYYKKKIGTT